MLCRIVVVIALISLPADVLLAQNVATSEGKKLDLKYISNDAVMAFVAHPRRMFTLPQAKLWPTEVLTAFGKQTLGFDPLDLEQVIYVLGIPKADGNDQPFGFILRFQRPIDADTIADKITSEGKDEKIENHRVRKANSPLDMSIVFVDDRTVLLTNLNEDFSWLLSAKPGDGPLHKLLTSADNSSDAAIYWAIEPTRPMLAETLQFLHDEMPAMFSDVLDLPMTVDTVKFTANLKGDDNNGIDLQIMLGTVDSETAKNVLEVVKRGLQDARITLVAQVSAMIMEDADDEARDINEAVVKYIERLSDAVVVALDPKAVGNHVTMNGELKVGIPEISLLSIQMLPAITISNEAARRNQSQNNLKQIALGLMNHEDKLKKMPAAATYDKDGKPLLSWRVYLLPEMEEGELFKEFHLDEPWDSEHNKKLIERMPNVYKHPKFNQPGKTLYLAVVGKGAAFEGQEGIGLGKFFDGTSKTITVVEVAPDKAVPWTKPEDWEFDSEKEIDTNDFGGLWQGGLFNVVFADGHVSAFPRSIDTETLKKMFTRDGGEVVQEP